MNKALLILLALTWFSSCGGGGGGGAGTGTAPAKGQGGKRAVPVAVEPVTVRSITVVIRAPATITAFETIDVVARVEGVVESLSFREGDRVTPDTVLAVIDADRYRLLAEGAEAAVTVAEAEQVEASSGLNRRQALEGAASFTDEELAQWQARAAAAEARVAQRRSELALARLDQQRSAIRPPRAGVVQTRSARTGQRVLEGALIATLLSADPLQARFSVSLEEAARLQPGAVVTLADEATSVQAVVGFIAGTADPATRRVAVVADLSATDALAFRPGAFVEARLDLEIRARPAIPVIAARPGEDGFTAFVVTDGVANPRAVRLGMRTADGRIEVVEGLAPGEILVVRGAEALSAGVPVRIVEGLAEAPVTGGEAKAEDAVRP